MTRTLSAACILRFPARPPFRPSAGRSPLPGGFLSVRRGGDFLGEMNAR